METRIPLPPGRKPTLCYVTDRRGLEAARNPVSGAAAAGEPTPSSTQELFEAIRQGGGRRSGMNCIEIRKRTLRRARLQGS